MASAYYKPCPELDRCNELIERYWKTEQYEKCFSGYLPLAEQGYPLAECQIGYFYLEGRGVEKDLEKAFCWTERAALSVAAGVAASYICKWLDRHGKGP